MTRRGTPEGAVLRLIQDYLLARRILFFRMNVGTMVGRHKGKSWAVKFGTTGMADVLAFPLTRKTHHNPTVVNLRGEVMDTRAVVFQSVMPLWIEAKAPKGEQTPQQVSFQKIVEDNGHAYLVARGIEPIEKWLKENQ